MRLDRFHANAMDGAGSIRSIGEKSVGFLVLRKTGIVCCAYPDLIGPRSRRIPREIPLCPGQGRGAMKELRGHPCAVVNLDFDLRDCAPPTEGDALDRQL